MVSYVAENKSMFLHMDLVKKRSLQLLQRIFLARNMDSFLMFSLLSVIFLLRAYKHNKYIRSYAMIKYVFPLVKVAFFYLTNT